MIKTSIKDRGLFLALTCTFEDENIWIIYSGASRHMTGEQKQLKTLSRGKYSYFVNILTVNMFDMMDCKPMKSPMITSQT